jgi:hypothetical protein
MTRLQAILERRETWPEERREPPADPRLAREDEAAGVQPPRAADELQALARSEEDVRAGRLVTDEEMREGSRRYRG